MARVSQKKGLWSEEEDVLLTAAVNNQLKLIRQRKRSSTLRKTRRSPIDWRAVSRKVPTRTGKQCRERWINHLSPEISKAKWTTEEDNVLLRLGRRFPNSWAYIARHLPNRSQNHVKIRWKSLTRISRRRKTSMIELQLGSIIDELDSQLWKGTVNQPQYRETPSIFSTSEPVGKRQKQECLSLFEGKQGNREEVSWMLDERISEGETTLLAVGNLPQEQPLTLKTMAAQIYFPQESCQFYTSEQNLDGIQE